MNIRRIFPIEFNLILKNWKDFIFQKEYHMKETMPNDGRKCFYLDAASYSNLGDQAISLSTELFLRSVFGNDNVVVINEDCVIRLLASLKKQIRPDDVIVLGGGGNMGDLYPRYEAIRRLIINKFQKNRIVVFPQTVDYSSDAYGKKQFTRGIKTYKKHRNLYVFLREEKSFNMLNGFIDNVFLVPDIVFYLYNKLEIAQTKKEGIQVGICFRNDKETLLTQDQRTSIENELLRTDTNIWEFSTIYNEDVDYDFFKRKRIVTEKINDIRKCSVVFTDRLHGMIFSLLAGVPCIAVDNSNCKISNVLKLVNEHTTGVYLCDDTVKIMSFLHEAQIQKIAKIDFFDSMYEELRKALA